jgi:hypothetical protein
MPTELRVQFQNYRVLRSPGERADGSGRYDVQRPDGTYCCRSILWKDVEEEVLADLRGRHPRVDGADAKTGL